MCMMWNLHRAASNSDRLVRSFFDVGFSLLLGAWWWYFHIWAASRRLCQVLTVCLCVGGCACCVIGLRPDVVACFACDCVVPTVVATSLHVFQAAFTSCLQVLLGE